MMQGEMAPEVEMTNPFESFQSTTGGRAGFSAYKELTEDKAFDDETFRIIQEHHFHQFLEKMSLQNLVEMLTFQIMKRNKDKNLKI